MAGTTWKSGRSVFATKDQGRLLMAMPAQIMRPGAVERGFYEGLQYGLGFSSASHLAISFPPLEVAGAWTETHRCIIGADGFQREDGGRDQNGNVVPRVSVEPPASECEAAGALSC